MHKLEVGQLYDPTQKSFPDGSRFLYDSSGLVLTIFARGLSKMEIEAVRSGQVELALYENQPAVFLLWKVKGFGPWSDAPYSIHLVSRENRPDPHMQIEEGQRLTLLIILVEGTTGIIQVLRYISTSTPFSILLNQAVARQTEQPFDHIKYHRHINNLYARYGSDKMTPMAEAWHKAGE